MVPSLFSSPAIMSSLAFVIELLKLSISQISLSRTPARSHHTANSMLAYILQELGMPSIGKDRCVMVHLAVQDGPSGGGPGSGDRGGDRKGGHKDEGGGSKKPKEGGNLGRAVKSIAEKMAIAAHQMAAKEVCFHLMLQWVSCT
jgi:hypothetical protein